MRISSKILLIALAVLLCGLLSYDMKLKVEYDKANFKKPFWDYTPLTYSNFNRIELQSATAINILIEQGPFKVLADPRAMEFLKINQKGNSIVIEAVFSDHYRSLFNEYCLYISCPDIKEFKSSAFYKASQLLIIDTIARETSWKPTVIRGFTLDTLDLKEDYASNVILEKNKIHTLLATVGINDNSGAKLTIEQGNKIDYSNLNIQNRSTLFIKDPIQNNYSYQLGDNAQIVLTGRAIKKLFKTIKP